MTNIIEQFFVPVKKIKRGEPLPTGQEQKKAEPVKEPEKAIHPKLHAWMKKNAKRR